MRPIDADALVDRIATFYPMDIGGSAMQTAIMATVIAAPTVEPVGNQELLKKVLRAWRQIKISCIETAKNNADEDGDKSVCDILSWVATMMDNLDEGWAHEID